VAGLAWTFTLSMAVGLMFLGGSPSGSAPATAQPDFPVRAAFFYPWFPQTWENGGRPNTNYTPALGYYASADDATIDEQLQLAVRAHLQAFIGSWWGQGHATDTTLQHILSRTASASRPESDLRWAIYYELEGRTDPTVEQIVSDMQYLGGTLFLQPTYLRVNDKPVVFAYADERDGAGMADRWAQATAQMGGELYVVLKVHDGYRGDQSQPDSWHQYAPALAYTDQTPYAVTVSPGFWKVGEQPRLARDPDRFEADVQRMVVSGAEWQLVTTWNEWGEGTGVEPTREFGSTYLDILCRNLPGDAACTSPAASCATGPQPAHNLDTTTSRPLRLILPIFG
jgi:hypothetical protein